MPYVTFLQSPAYHQVSWEDILMGASETKPLMITQNKSNTRTYFAHNLPQNFLSQYDFGGMYYALKHFNETHAALFDTDRDSLYRTFYIPKRSGGLRQINAPNDDLMTALRELKEMFEHRMGALYHTSAFAYVRGRSSIDAVRRHQQNDSRWFLKTDFTDFFGNTTELFVRKMLSQIFPFSYLMEYSDIVRNELEHALSLCFLHGGLPQGTPISPMLTNLVMIPIDFRLCNVLRKRDEHFIYTRYADDIQISSRQEFDKAEVVRLIENVLAEFSAPYSIKPEKTRYGSRNGSNWNLGVMLNKDNEITIGHKRKKQYLAMISNYVRDKKAGVQWGLHDVRTLDGLTNYYKMVEKETIERMIAYSNQKFSVNFEAMVKEDLAS